MSAVLWSWVDSVISVFSTLGSVGTTCHNSTVPSALPLAIVRPSGLNTTLKTESVCPVSLRFSTPL